MGDRTSRAAATLEAGHDAVSAATAVVQRVGFAPIVRVDAERREIELCATSEALDSYGTIFSYEASRDAFQRWAGNVREMHERKAVGRRVAVRCDDDARRVYVRARISKGAEDTWEKVCDGTLRGASIGASNVEWRKQRRGGREVPVAVRYDLVELSLVDLPSNPDALGVTFVRDGVPLADVLDELEADGPAVASPRPSDEAQSLPQSAGTPAPAPSPLPQEPGSPVPVPAPSPSPQGGGVEPGPAEEPVEERIAREALRAGRSWVAGEDTGKDALVEQRPSRAARLAALAAPGYVRPEPASALGADAPGAMGRDNDQHTQPDDRGASGSMLDLLHGDAGTVRPARSAAPDALGFDGHAPDRYAHEPHDHAHSGEAFSAADAHRHNGPHLHLDGTSHSHEHSHDHQHGDHAGQAHSQAGHSHPHAHVHDHGHAYRVADGSIVDERLVPAETRWVGEYVGEDTFCAVGGVAGRYLAPEQARAAVAAQRALMRHFGDVDSGTASRELGPFSNNPDGPPDTGVPARAEERPTSAAYGQVPEGNREDVLHSAARGILQGCGCPACLAALAALDAESGGDGAGGRAMDATVTRALELQTRRLDAAIQGVRAGVGELATTLRAIERRVAVIEEQPMPGGPHLRVADKTHALAPGGAAAAVGEQMRALEALAGRLSDPQAQIAVAAEMIRLQQAAAGLTPAQQVMPRAGSGAGRTG